jgi:hypothetical protein
MSTPMYDVPEHFPIGVNSDGNGPYDGIDARIVCWCGTEGCKKYDQNGGEANDTRREVGNS